ncbi:hypothetical protein GZ22_04020 [Terribacillus saccharophilus]|uniref:Uncharacterized protein n=1 Tax=Terribacillus saccharophilus TaxID=361277 RepID=A0A075LN98_9BACI|nr:hypothetical protein GZ22_04020 [Terribacillus goriensis]
MAQLVCHSPPLWGLNDDGSIFILVGGSTWPIRPTLPPRILKMDPDGNIEVLVYQLKKVRKLKGSFGAKLVYGVLNRMEVMLSCLLGVCVILMSWSLMRMASCTLRIIV